MTAIKMGKLTRQLLNAYEKLLDDNGYKELLKQNHNGLRELTINDIEKTVNWLEKEVIEFEKLLNLNELKELLNKLKEFRK